jgi:hypothetical protein
MEEKIQPNRYNKSNKKSDAGIFSGYAPSTTDVNEEGPLRGWHTFFPELRHGFVNSVCDSVQVKVLVFKETLIEPACNVLAIFVMHHPASSSAKADFHSMAVDSPQCGGMHSHHSM